MKIYIVIRHVDGSKKNVIVTSSKKSAEHMCSQFNFIDSYEIEEHDLMDEVMMQSN